MRITYYDEAGSDLQHFARSGVQPLEVNMSGSFGPAAKFVSTLAAAIDKAPCPTKALVLTNPHKLLGQCYPQEVLEACLRFCQQRDIHFISDEVYALTEFSCAEVSDPAPFVSILSLNTRALKCERSRIHTIWSTGVEFGASGFRLGCIVSQDNPKLINRLALSPNSEISSLSAILTTNILSSPNLPFLIALSSARLAEAYICITTFFTERNIKYIPVGAGLNLFAQLAPKAKTWSEEDDMVEKLRGGGVLVSPGRHHYGRPPGKGWARISFSVEPWRLQEALKRMDLTLSSKNGVPQ
ncbi:predicted protein [Uncinocarpus reesii 1704]|uniref:Aminotransferase class I/classII large domain-containing protein n=1 Tax=Uncinocarpus reesii (strain UAMH 1704) TaxID=336963 RepID=C4JM34_UNCRE|nr:uncharacterized protein UREG_03892 [Uncinocarpus reesii 1704]EEP79046.1 predicted protein [Uncinocarpus reesii 1704]